MLRRKISSANNKSIASFLSLIFLCATMLATARPATAQADHITDHFIEPFDITVSAAEGCSGEDVHIFGIIVGTMQTTIDAQGGEHISIEFVPFLVGEGESTGRIYLPKGPAHVTSLVAPSGTTVLAATNIIRLVSPGSGGNVVATEHIHLTINPDGTVTVNRDYVTFACRG